MEEELKILEVPYVVEVERGKGNSECAWGGRIPADTSLLKPALPTRTKQ